MMKRKHIARWATVVTLTFSLAGVAYAMNETRNANDQMELKPDAAGMPIDPSRLSQRPRLPREWVWRRKALDFNHIYGQRR